MSVGSSDLDIVERLRIIAEQLEEYTPGLGQLLMDAADEIERLRERRPANLGIGHA